jgi:hypothetical protein
MTAAPKRRLWRRPSYSPLQGAPLSKRARIKHAARSRVNTPVTRGNARPKPLPDATVHHAAGDVAKRITKRNPAYLDSSFH